MARSEQKSTKSESKTFSSGEICRIIKVAKKQGVQTVKIGDFFVTFHEKESKAKLVSHQNGFEGKSDLPKEENVPLTASKPVAADEKALVLQDKRVLEEFRITQMLIDDPVSFEEAEIDAAITGNSEMVRVDEENERY